MTEDHTNKIPNQKLADIKFNDVTVTASSKVILEGIDLEIEKGEMVAILGKSGAGKSTLLRVIAGFVKPSKNNVLVDGVDFFSHKKHKAHVRGIIGFIPQQFRLIKELSVFENVIIGRLAKIGRLASMFRLYPKKDRTIVLEYLFKVGLIGKDGLAARKLSGGEQQRVAIARCLAQEPQIILADEPVASLDTTLVETILEILDHENKKGKTVVFVMHNVDLARRFARRMILMKDGKIISDKPTGEINEDVLKSVFN